MRVVIDTNILVSHLFWPHTPLSAKVETLLRHAELLRSAESFAELSQVVMRRKFDAYLGMAERELFLAMFHDLSMHVMIAERISACRDPRDDMFLELAVNGDAELLVTGDADLLCLDPFRGVRIVAPSAL